MPVEAPVTMPLAVAGPAGVVVEPRVVAGGVFVESPPAFDGRVASFISLDGLGPGNEAVFSATIDWGDGSPVEAGQIAYNTQFQQWDVRGQHTYAGPNSFAVSVTVSENIGGTSATASSTIVVAAAPGGQLRQIIDDLLTPLIASKTISNGQGKTLVAKLESAIERLEAGDTAGAIGALKQFLKTAGGIAHGRPQLRPVIEGVAAALAGLSAV